MTKRRVAPYFPLLLLLLFQSCAFAQNTRRQITVATVADLYLASPADDDVYTTRGYSQEGVGGNTYRYDASAVTAVDYGYVLDGRGGNGSGTGTGRFIAVTLNEIRATQYGVLPSGDSTVAFGRAVDAAMARGLPLLVDLPAVSLATWTAKTTTASLTIRSTYSTPATVTGPGGAIDLLTLASGDTAIIDHVRFASFRYVANQGGADLASLRSTVNVVPTVASLYALEYARDNEVYQTLGYHTEGIGDNLYRYDAGSSATPNYGFIVDGPGGNGTGTGTGRFIAMNQTRAVITQFGAYPDVSTDSGPAIRRALTTGKPVDFPGGVYTVAHDPASAFTDGGNTRYAYSINVPSNAVLHFHGGATIKQANGVQSWTRVVVMNNVSGVKCFGELKVDGNVANAGTPTNEHNHGVFIFDATNIHIERIDSRNCRGDNVFIGGTNETTVSSGIHIGSIKGVAAGRKNLVLQHFDNVFIGEADLDNTGGGASLYSGGVADDTDKHCFDVEPDSFTGAAFHRVTVGSLVTKGTGFDFTSGVDAASADKCIVNIGTIDHTHTSSTVKVWLHYGATVTVDKARFTGIAGVSGTFEIWYAARLKVGQMFVSGSTPAVADPMFLIGQVSGHRPLVNIDLLELTNTVGAGIEVRDGGVRIGRYVPRTAGIVGWARGLWTADQVVADQTAMLALTGRPVGYVVIQTDDIAASATTVWTFNGPLGQESTLGNWSASNGLSTEVRIDYLDMENVGTPAGAGYAFYVSKDGSLQPVADIGRTAFRDSRTPKLNYVYLIGSGAAAQISLGVIENQTAVANASWVGTDKFIKLAGGGTTPGVYVCTGTPESMIAAPIGSTALRIDGGASTAWYAKESGTGNTGWVAK